MHNIFCHSACLEKKSTEKNVQQSCNRPTRVNQRQSPPEFKFRTRKESSEEIAIFRGFWAAIKRPGLKSGRERHILNEADPFKAHQEVW